MFGVFLRNLGQGISVAYLRKKDSLEPRYPTRISRAELMRPIDKATADNRSVLSFAIIKTLDTGILLLALFKLELEMHYPSEIACVQSPPPPFSDFF